MIILQPGQRKFILAMFCAANAFALCWGHRLSGGETVTVVSVLAALYKAANIIDKRLGGAG